jgi:hypothetical protein
MKVTISWKGIDEKGKSRVQKKEYDIRVETEDDAVEWAITQAKRLGINDPDIEVDTSE